MVAGGLSGAVSKTATAPLERVKILFQIQGMRQLPARNLKYKSISQSLLLILKEEGLWGWFKGNGSNVVRIIPVYALKFTFNDVFQGMVMKEGQNVKELSFAQLLLAGTTAGLFQMAATYPIETVRTRMTLSKDLAGGTVYRGIIDCLVRTAKDEGFFALYKGFNAAMVSGAPYVGLQMAFYQLGQNMWPQDQVTWYGKLLVGAVAGVSAQTLMYPGDTVRVCSVCYLFCSSNSNLSNAGAQETADIGYWR